MSSDRHGTGVLSSANCPKLWSVSLQFLFVCALALGILRLEVQKRKLLQWVRVWASGGGIVVLLFAVYKVSGGSVQSKVVCLH